MTPPDTPTKLTRKHFTSDQEVRWCPGCGDYAILAAVQRTLPDVGVAPDNTVFISGIGCSSRFPYYMNTYGFHTIHGRAPALATGLKLSRPELDVWIVTGDGDGLSIGGNHLLHVLRRNVDVQILLFNNRIYGLTKGQYSPTTLIGQRTPSTPYGSLDAPLAPALFALGANASFVARGIDTVQKTLAGLLKRAHDHKGAAFIEILQNCPVFHDGAWTQVTARDQAPATQLWVEHGQPLVFGPDKRRGLRRTSDGSGLEIATIGEQGVTEADILVHNEQDRGLAFMLAQLAPPTFPMAFGVLFRANTPTYDHAVAQQNRETAGKLGAGDLGKLLRSGSTWRVK